MCIIERITDNTQQLYVKPFVLEKSRSIEMRHGLKKAFFPILGLTSLIWFLMRVIPKPSRAAYPCMRTAAPLASTFVVYVTGFLTSIFFFKRAQKFWRQSRYVVFTLALVLAASFAIGSFLQNGQPAYALVNSHPEGPNAPMGEGVGIFPGRVVWIHNPEATNENCRNRTNDYWSDDKNTDQTVVNAMLSEALQALSGTNSDNAAWDALFRDFNVSFGKGDVGYQATEKIVIKINLNSNGCGNTSNNYERWNYKTVDTSPQLIYALLDQLINMAGVPQANIGIGDPGRNVDDLIWDKCHAEFPDVEYWGKANGRTKIERTTTQKIHTSDGSMSDYLPQCYVDAAYMINVPVFKKHHRGGISVSSKNHFGSFVPFHGSASHWHFSLPASEGGGNVNNGDYGLYRCFVDFIGHEHIGGKTMLYLVDGIWGSTNWAHPPIKWRMSPFNDDWPSSIFLSQDPVAVESVVFDFLYTEFDQNHPTEGKYDPSDNKGPFPRYAGVDDFLHQAADSDNWPEGIIYDPEQDGSPLPASMGVHEHWNNAEEKLYSRNMGKDEGIELVTGKTTDSIANTPVRVNDFKVLQNYPNPFNPTTTIEYRLSAVSQVNLSIYNAAGQYIETLISDVQHEGHHTAEWSGRLANGAPAASGVYIYKLTIHSDTESIIHSRKMVLSR